MQHIEHIQLRKLKNEKSIQNNTVFIVDGSSNGVTDSLQWKRFISGESNQ